MGRGWGVKIKDIRKFGPCYNPTRWCAEEDRDFTIMDVLVHPIIPPKDKVWFATRKGFLPDLTLYKFAIWCARQYESVKETRDYINVIEQFYIFKTATEEEMNEACNAADWAAHRAAHRAADWAAYWAADRATDSVVCRTWQVIKIVELMKEDGI
jgi:hypothetical protein